MCCLYAPSVPASISDNDEPGASFEGLHGLQTPVAASNIVNIIKFSKERAPLRVTSMYIAQALAAQEAIWIQLRISEFNVVRLRPTPLLHRRDIIQKPLVIHADNQGAIVISKNPESMHERSI